MTTTLAALPSARPIPPGGRKKRVLLVDGSSAKRDLRADAMRTLGMDVDCACDIGEARSWWKAELYDLVIMNVHNDRGYRDKFCEDVRGATPPQQLVFVVGKPEYFSAAPAVEITEAMENPGEQSLQNEASSVPPCDVSATLPLRWGIMEASRRISAVRSVSAARVKAVRNLPPPPRDREILESRRAEVMSQLASELQKEELL